MDRRKPMIPCVSLGALMVSCSVLAFGQMHGQMLHRLQNPHLRAKKEVSLLHPMILGCELTGVHFDLVKVPAASWPPEASERQDVYW